MFSVINSFEVRFPRHRIPLTLILPLAISLLLELAAEKKVNLFQMRFSVPGFCLFHQEKIFLKVQNILKVDAMDSV